MAPREPARMEAARGMIETFPRGIAHFDVTGEIMAACAGLPVLVWNGRGGGYCLPDAGGLTRNIDQAGRWTLAQAFMTMIGTPDAELHTYQPVDFVKLDVPLPPSTNALFCDAPNPKGPRSRIKTRPYKRWIEDATMILKPQLAAQGAPPLPTEPLFGPHWAIWIRVNIDHQGDVTNRIKAVEDLIVKHNITCGDQWNDRCVVDRDRTLDVDCRVIIYRKVLP